MHRVAFVVDRGFHHIGLHGGVAVPFLIGLGCNVPAISAAATTGSRRERVVSAILITFVPCSARSAIILAIGGKYLGGPWRVRHFHDDPAGHRPARKTAGTSLLRQRTGHGSVHPAYSLPRWGKVWRKTWERTEDIVTIVTPLLVIGSIVLRCSAILAPTR